MVQLLDMIFFANKMIIECVSSKALLSIHRTIDNVRKYSSRVKMYSKLNLIMTL